MSVSAVCYTEFLSGLEGSKGALTSISMIVYDMLCFYKHAFSYMILKGKWDLK